MAELLSGQISFTGLGSGTDFQTMVQKLIEIESNHKTQLELWKTQWEDKIDALQEMNSAMLSLKTTLGSMDTMPEFLVKQTESSDPTLLTATADSDAETGNYTITVNQLAKNAIITNNSGFTSETESINDSGTTQQFAYTYMGQNYSLNISTGTSLQSLANSINSDPSNPGVRASIISDGASFYLQMRGLDQGSAASLSFNASLSTLTHSSFNSSDDFQVNQQNQDAQIRVNGWPNGSSDAWISTDTNSISGIIEGLTINLKNLGSSPPTDVSISVANDTEGIKENVRNFVDQMNEVRTLIKQLTKFDDIQKSGSVMTGNYGVQIIDSNLRVAVANIADGFVRYGTTGVSNAGDMYTSLSQLGILTDAEEGSPTQGLLLLDEGILDDILREDADAVAELFAADYIGDSIVASNAGNFSYASHITGITKAGAYDVTYDIDGNGNIVNAFINGVAANVDQAENTITAANGDARGLSIQVNDLTPDSSGSGIARLKLGKMGELHDILGDLTNATDGPLHIIEQNYGDIIDNIDKKIDYEEVRLERMKRDLTMKFARLEATLGQYDQIQNSLASSVNKLPSASSG